MGMCTKEGIQGGKNGVHCCKQHEGLFPENIVWYMGCSRLGSSRSGPGDDLI